MPMPTPRPTEARQAFINRFMSSEAMRREYPRSEQRYAVCMSQWERRRHNKK